MEIVQAGEGGHIQNGDALGIIGDRYLGGLLLGVEGGKGHRIPLGLWSGSCAAGRQRQGQGKDRERARGGFFFMWWFSFSTKVLKTRRLQ